MPISPVSSRRALAGRAVGGNVAEVALLAPDAVLDQLVHGLHTAGKCAGHGHIGVDGVGGEHGIGQVGVGLDLWHSGSP